MSEKKLLIILIAFVSVGILLFVSLFFIYGGGIAVNEKTNMPKETKTVIIPGSSKFQTNLKGTRNIISLSFQIEILEDKKLLAIMDNREPEARSRVLNILRDKSVEDTNGTQGKIALEKEILNCYRSLYGETSIINIYIDDIVIQ